MAERTDQIKALSNETRLEVLRVLDDPARHFGHQESADPVAFGVCMNLIADHFGVTQPTMSRHLDLLRRAGFIATRRHQKWTYCRRDEEVLSDYADWMRQSLKIRNA